MLDAIQFQGEIIALFQGLISADFFDELAVAGAAAVRDHNAKHRRVRCPDPLHANSYCHNKSIHFPATPQWPAAPHLFCAVFQKEW